MRRAIAAFFTLTALLLLSACETAKGAGRDIQKAGQAISGAAADVQDAL